jgi:hypothetical protein
MDNHIVTDALTGMTGQTAIIDFYHCEGDDFRITPAAGWASRKTIRFGTVTRVGFWRIVTAHESSHYWAFNRPGEVAYEVDYL